MFLTFQSPEMLRRVDW